MVMNYRSGFKIKTKMVAGFTLIALVAGAIGLLAVLKIREVNNGGTLMYEKSTIPIGVLTQVALESQWARVNLRGMLLDSDPDRSLANAENVRKRYTEVDRLMSEFEKDIVDNVGRAEFEAIRTQLTDYRPLWEEIIRLHLAGQKSYALDLMRGKAQKIESSIAAAIRKLIEMKIGEGKSRDLRNNAISHHAVVQTVVFSVLGVLLAIAMGIAIAVKITAPIKDVVELAERIANGDLTSEVEIKSRDETGQLSIAMNAMTRQLNILLAAVAKNSRQVAESACELNATAEQMASGTREVAAQATTIAAASEEMTTTSNEIANSCVAVAAGSHNASMEAAQGATVVQETVARMNQIAVQVQESARTMEELGKHSDEIGTIIGTIEDIADQTNLLALNAAIEAARAGEQGRGFAVVADEVRALAERTTKATKEIATMIKSIQHGTNAAVSQMENGVNEVGAGITDAARSGSALKDIIEHINTITMQVNQIATAAEEQSATTQDITNNIQVMTEIIQDTAHGAVQSASAANNLSGLADELQGLVGKFRIKS
jgi:methyl-accepting chemotaxis protein